MAHRDQDQGYRGGDRSLRGSGYDRDYDTERFERQRRDDRWDRNRDLGEFAGSGEYSRRRRDWDEEERGYRGFERDYGEDWQGGRYGPGYRERGGLFSRGMPTRSYSGPESPEWARDEIDRRVGSRRFDYGGRGGEDYGGYGAPWQAAGYEQSGFAFPRRYGEYGGYGSSLNRGRGGYESGMIEYGPSTGYGYGPTESYIGSESATRRSVGKVGQRNFAGRGPRNYRRSEERITEDVNERLMRHPDLDATDIDVRVENATVTLSGVVEDRRAKRLAEDIVEDVWGVDDVRNELKVRHGFLASLTGEQADEREVTRPAVREAERARQTTAVPGTPRGTTGATSTTE